MRLSQTPSAENSGAHKLSGLRVFGSTKPSEVNDFLPFAAASLAFGKPSQINVCLKEKAKFSGLTAMW